MAEMATSALSNNLLNPAREYLFEMIFPNPPFGSVQSLLLRCKSSVLPGRDFGDIIIPFKQGPGVIYPGKLNLSHHLPLTFHEGEDRAIFLTFYQWMNMIVDIKTGLSQGEPGYRRDLYLNLLNTTGVVAMRYKMTGSYPKLIEEKTLDQSSEKELDFSVVMAFNEWLKVD